MCVLVNRWTAKEGKWLQIVHLIFIVQQSKSFWLFTVREYMNSLLKLFYPFNKYNDQILKY